MTDSIFVNNLVEFATSSFRELDIVVNNILVNNAALSGDVQGQLLAEIESDRWDHVMAVNVRGTFECIKLAVPAMRRRDGGSIVNLSSATTIKGTPRILYYVASKGAVTAMTRVAARELGDDNIRVDAVAAGLTMTESVRRQPLFQAAALAANINSRCLKREALPDDIVGAVIFLASQDSSFITGQTIVVDGGAVMI